MLRRCITRLTHQTMKEPLGHEENTFARGNRTLAKSLHHIKMFSLVSGLGCIAALFTFAQAHNREYLTVGPEGKMGKGRCPVYWWNY